MGYNWGVLINEDAGIEAWRKLHKSTTGYTMGDDAVASWRQEKLAQMDRFVRSLQNP